MAHRPTVSVVIPAHNEAQTIGATLQRIREVAAGHQNFELLEVIVVSDGSDDETYETALSQLQSGPAGRIVQLVRNAGSHNAIRCGMRYVTGDLVAVLAADGQDPPEVLPEMVGRIGSGTDIVWGARRSRGHDPFFTRIAARMYYRLFRTITGLEYPSAGLDFVLFTRRVSNAILEYRERNLSLFLMLFNLGFGQVEIEYDRGERVSGQSSWTFRKRAKMGIDMLTAFSPAPIRLVSVLGLLIGLFGMVFGVITVVRALVGEVPIEGWASLMVITSMMGGLILIGIALIGEYLWRTLDEARSRPLFVEERSVRVEHDVSD